MNHHETKLTEWPHAFSAAGSEAAPASRADDPPLTTLGDVVHGVARRWRPLAIWLLACLAAAVWYLHVTPPEYTASATVLLGSRRATATGDDAASAGYAEMLDSAQADSQSQVIKSERNLASVFDLLDLRHAPEFADRGPGLRERVATALNLAPRREPVDPAEAEAEARMRAFQAFSNRVGVRRVGQSYVLEVSYSAGSPVQAARVANAVTSAYLLAQVDRRAAAVRNGAEYLQGRIQDIKAEREAALDGIRQGRVPTMQFPDAEASVIGGALRPLAKSAPQTVLVIAFALSAGLLTGLLAIAVGRALDRTLRTRAQVQHALGVGCLGVIPDAARLRGMRAARRGSALGHAVIAAPESGFAEAVRSARTAVMLPFGGNRGRSIGFVSWSEGEGRTTLASNLAHLMAVSGNPVELIDADLRHPTLTGRLAPRSPVGLSEALADHSGLSELRTVELSPTLSFLPAVGLGRAIDPNVYLGAPEMVDLLSTLTAARDVVLDLPPLGTSSAAQALCPFLDGVVLVIEAGRTRIEDALDALRVLRSANANVLGVLLNRADAGDTRAARA